MGERFVIRGGQRLCGEYPIQGNKNAALALISAALLKPGTYRFSNVPRIADVENLVEILTAMGVPAVWIGSSLEIDAGGFKGGELPDQLVEKLRGSILLLGVLAPLQDHITCVRPGGCAIGRRSFDVHWDIFRAAGFEADEGRLQIELKRTSRVKDPRVYLRESSVTATENALTLFCALGGGVIENPAREPHVLSLIDFLRKLGCEIETHPLYYQVHRGVGEESRGVDFPVPGDYTDAGTAVIAAAATGGEMILHGISPNEFAPIQHAFEEFGIVFERTGAQSVRVLQVRQLVNPSKLTAGLWPSFPTDLISLAIVLATRGQGLCLVHDWMYESRMFFVDKLVRMGAQITMCDPHRVLVEGPAQLRGTRLESPDIRAGMALVVAGLCADGVTTIEHAEIVGRGYERVVERFAALGAEIEEG